MRSRIPIVGASVPFSRFSFASLLQPVLGTIVEGFDISGNRLAHHVVNYFEGMR